MIFVDPSHIKIFLILLTKYKIIEHNFLND